MLRLLNLIALAFALLQGPSGVLLANIDFKVAGNLQDALYGNGVRTSYDNNPLSLSGIRNASREVFNGVERKVDYYYDPLNRLIRETVGPIAAPTSQAVYDSAPGYSADGFDKVGNRQSRSAGLGLPAQSFTYNERDEINGPTFDKNGNTKAFGGVTYGYDYENRLLSANAVTMVYDGDGNRVRKTVNGLTTHFLVDELNPTGYAQTLQEKVGSDPATAAISREYVWGHRLISQTASGDTHYYIHDGHGSTRALVQGTTVTDTYNYDAFGNGLPQSESAPPNLTPNNYRYTGEQWDPDLSLYYLRARYYHPGTGRFLTLDTFEGNQNDPLSLHKYLYTHADPINNVDPSGHENLGNVITAVSISFNLASAGNNLRKGNYGMAAFDMIGAASGAFGLASKLLPPGLRYAGAGASAAVSAQEAATLARGLSMIIAGTDIANAMVEASSGSDREHHIMTNKNDKSPAGGGPFTPKFRELLEGTGIDFEDAINKVMVAGHRGPHPGANRYTYDALLNAVKNLPRNSEAYREAVQKTLQKLSKEAATPGNPLNKMLTGL